jgi:hypothetical protein
MENDQGRQDSSSSSSDTLGLPAALDHQAVGGRYVKRGAVVTARRLEADTDDVDGLGLRGSAGDWVINHGSDIREIARPEAFDSTYESLDVHTTPSVSSADADALAAAVAARDAAMTGAEPAK